MLNRLKAHPNEVADVRLSQDALHRLYQFHAAYVAGRPGGRRAMLRRCDLSGLDFSHMDFSDAIFIDCDLTAIDSRGAKFNGAVLLGTTFDPVDVAELRSLEPDDVARRISAHAIWVMSQGRDGHRADFSCVDLTAADFSGRNLCLADLSGARLADAQLQSARLIAADFRGADLSRANLAYADLRGANFQDSQRRDIDLSNAKVGAIPGLSLATSGL